MYVFRAEKEIYTIWRIDIKKNFILFRMRPPESYYIFLCRTTHTVDASFRQNWPIKRIIFHKFYYYSSKVSDFVARVCIYYSCGVCCVGPDATSALTIPPTTIHHCMDMVRRNGENIKVYTFVHCRWDIFMPVFVLVIQEFIYFPALDIHYRTWPIRIQLTWWFVCQKWTWSVAFSVPTIFANWRFFWGCFY